MRINAHLVAILAVLVCWNVAPQGAAPRTEFLYKGQGVKFWREQLSKWTIHFYYPPPDSPISARDKDALPMLLHLAKDADAGIRFSAIAHLGKAEPCPIVLQAVALAAEDSAFSVQLRAIRILGGYGAKARAVKAVLEDVLKHSGNEDIKEASRHALDEIEQKSEK